MRMIRFSILAILLAGIVLPGLYAQPPSRKESTTSRIQKKTYDFKEAGKEMEYAVFVPSNYDKAKKSPLVVLLHGLGSNPQQIMPLSRPDRSGREIRLHRRRADGLQLGRLVRGVVWQG